MKTLVVYNKNAGSAGRLAEIKKAFSGNEEVSFTALHPSMKQRIDQAVEDGCGTVVAAGGDGTVNAVLQEVMRHKKVILGVLPIGTLNHFAQDLGLPTDLQQAAKLIIAHKTRRIDVAKVNEHYFVNNASFGFYPQLVMSRESNEQRLGKWPALAWAFLKLLPKFRRYHVRLTYNGRTHQYRSPFIFIGNNQYDIHTRNFTTRQHLTEGTLVAYILKTAHFKELLRVGWRALAGTLRQERMFTIVTAHEIVLERTPGKTLLIAYDGETTKLPPTKATFKIYPKALSVITN